MILNLTQHPATPEQLAEGVIDPAPAAKAAIVAGLTFNSLPESADILARAEALAYEAEKYCRPSGQAAHGQAMVGGAPYLMAALEAALLARGITPVYAFSQRESAEEVQADGSVRKVAIFRHAGFVAASPR